MYHELDLGELDYFKVVVDIRLVEKVDPEDDQHLKEEPWTMLPIKEVVPTY